MTTKLTVTPSLLPVRVSWSLDEPETGVNICSGHCYRRNLQQEIDAAVAGAMRAPSPAQDDAILFTNWVEIAEAVQRAVQLAVLVLVFVISTGYASGRVNLRECPSTSCRVVATLAEGTVIVPASGVPVNGSPVGAWTQAWTPEGEGWIYSEYVEGQS